MNRALRATLAIGVAAFAVGGSGLATAVDPPSAFAQTETITRTHLVDGADQLVDKRTVKVTVSQTKNLRDRQAVTVTWTGAHPTGGLVADPNSAAAAMEEYPVVVMQCRGTDSTSVPAAKRVSPKTCWTQTPGERFQYSQSGFLYPPYRMDRYAPTEDRAFAVDQPDPLPTGCSPVAVPHWVPFVAANGTSYPGGVLGCGGLAPEAANSADSLQPGNTTYGVADENGDGSAKFVVQTADTNASLGCSATVACTLEVIPIMGVSCDAAGTASDAPDRGMATAQRPSASLVSTIYDQCSKTGHFPAGAYNGGSEVPDLAVSGQLWWASSNWQNRISVPLTIAPSASVCDVVDNAATVYLYGSEAMLQATQQWGPHFCLDRSLFVLRHVQTSEPQAKNLLNVGAIQGALQGAPPTTPFAHPTVQAPVAVTGFAIAYSIDGADGTAYRNLKLNARLLAKLLSESYRSCALDCLDFTSKPSQKSGFAKLATNPIDMSRDPEFQALNPGIPVTNYLQSAAALAVMSSDSDVMHALSSYINADPEARDWLNGVPDPWGMVVNPAYKHIALPVDNWPLLDTHIAHLGTGANLCLTQNPVPWLPLVAAPVSNPAMVALNMQFDIANSQTTCKDNGQQNQKLTAVGRQAPGERFLIGLVSLADAARYQVDTAQLQSHNTNTDTGTFDDASGRSFAAPTPAGLQAAARFLTPEDTLGTWKLPYDEMRTATTGAKAYPGTMLMSADVPTSGLNKGDASRYATFLRFAGGPGQVTGLGTGQLPPGYLPLTSANGLGALSTYTRIAADHVQRQAGTVPLVSDPKEPPPLPSRSPITGSHRPTQPSGSAGAGSPGAAATGSASRAPGTNRASKIPSPSPTTSVAAAPVAQTGALTAGPLGLALPVLALLGFLSLGTAAWMSGIGRRR
ncbi:MAG: hypothetical protein QOG01_1472 [Pseudonocardiales bacterium]|nr:hypothetical protein [Pseudonocardiales bacterium]